MAGEKLISKALQAVRKSDPLGFYSKAAEEAQRLPQAKGTGEQMRAMLLKQGAKPEELKWTGFDDWAKGKKSVTRDEVADYLEKNRVQVGEKVLGADPDIAKKIAARNSRLEAVNKETDELSASEIAAGRVPAQNPRWKELEKEYYSIVDSPFPEFAPTKFSQYSLPGGENYRELQLALPDFSGALRKETAEAKSLRTQAVADYANAPPGSPEAVEAQERIKKYTKIHADLISKNTNLPPEYRSSHYDEPNLLAHMRMSDRTDPEGRRVLLLDELQSDWAQEGRKQGFKNPDDNMQNLVKEYDYLTKQRRALEVSVRNGDDADPATQAAISQLTEVNNSMSALSDRMATARSNIPTGPFVGSTPGWTDLALKRALREAAEGNYDAMAWTPGATQAARYPGGTPEEEAKRLKGMIGYYDKVLPTQLQKMTRDLDPNVAIERMRIPVQGQNTSTEDIARQLNMSVDQIAALPTDQKAQLIGSVRNTMEFPSLTITPEMREKIKQGLPLFTAPAVGLGAATQMQSGENPVTDEPRGFAGGGKIVAKALQAAMGSRAKRAEDTVRLFHGTTEEGQAGINEAKKIYGPAFFSPRREAAETYSLNNSSNPFVVEADVPKRQLMIDLDLPGARLLSIEDANSYLGNADWSIDDYLKSNYSVGVPSGFDLKSHGGAAVSTMPQQEDQGFRRGGSVDQALRLLQDQYPTQYMPNVGRQVMQAGGTTGEAMTLEDILALIRSGGAELKEFDPRIPQISASRAFGLQGSKFPNQAMPIVPTVPYTPDETSPRPLTVRGERSAPPPASTPFPSFGPIPPPRPRSFDAAPSAPAASSAPAAPQADDSVSRALWAAYNESESPADFLRADAAMREGRAGGGKSVKKLFELSRRVLDYTDPASKKIEDWKWRPLPDVAKELNINKIPPHVQQFGDYMVEMADKAKRGEISDRDLIKAYTTTRASIQRRSQDTDKIREASGLPLVGAEEKIRPEGAWSEWLMSPAGQRYLDKAVKGEMPADTVESALSLMRSFGLAPTQINAMDWAAKNLPGRGQAASDLVYRASQKASPVSEWRDFTSDVAGVGSSKSGFLASLLGRGDLPTLDARQVILNTGLPTEASQKAMARSYEGQKGFGAQEGVDRLAARQEALDLKAPQKYDPFYQHLTHHTIWDKASGEKTTHADIMNAMRNAAVVLGTPAAGAAFMSEEQPDAAMREGRAGGGKAIAQVLAAIRNGPARLPSTPSLDKFMPERGPVRLPSTPSLEEFMAERGPVRLPSTPSLDEFMPERGPVRLPSTPSLDEFMPERGPANLPSTPSLDEFMPEGRYAGGGKAVSKALKAVSEMFDSPGMTQWREGSKIPSSSVEDRYFTGTSKDKDFANFNVGRHGAWFTKDPTEASAYALDNDSRNLRYNPDTRRYNEVNSASRVIPTFLRSENPFTGPRPQEIHSAENYKKAQSDWFDQLRAQGHDAWIPDELKGDLAVILKDPSQIKSAISNTGDFDRASPRVDRAEGGEVGSDEDIRQYERVMAEIAEQPEDIRSMTHGPSIPMRPVEIEGGLVGKRQLGSAPYNVAGPLSTSAQLAYDMKSLPFYFTPAAPFAAASDTAEMAINMAKSIKKGDYLGAGIEGVLGVAPGAIAFRKPIANAGRQAVDYARSLGRQYAEGGSVEQEQPGLVDRAMSFLSQFNPVGSAEASPASAIAKRVMRGSDLIAKDPRAAVSQLSERDPLGNVDFGQAINNSKYTFSKKGDLQPWREFDAQQAVKEKAIIAGILGDRSAAGSLVHDINGVKLTDPVNRFGGGEFQRSTEGPEVWASRPTAVNNMYTRINKGMNELGASSDNPVLAAQVLMGTPAIDSTQMMAKAILRQIEPTRGQINPETAKAFDVAIRKKFPGWPGILNPEEAEQFLKTNEVGKRTSTILQQLDQMKAQEGGLPNLGSARFAMMEPRLVSADQGSTGFAISRLDPRGVTNAAAHDTYPTGMLGPSQSAADYMGGTRYQIPLNVMFPDWWKTVKPTYVEKKSGLIKAASPTNIQQSVMTQVPLQRATQEWYDNLMKYTEQNPKKWGYRLGGVVKKQKIKKSAKIK